MRPMWYIYYHRFIIRYTFSFTQTIPRFCFIPPATIIQAWTGGYRFSHKHTNLYLNSHLQTDSHSLWGWRPHAVTSPSECHVGVLSAEAGNKKFFLPPSSRPRFLLLAHKLDESWEGKGASQVELERGGMWNARAYIGRAWQSRAAPAFTSSLTERRITIGGRRAATRRASETFLTCLVSLHRRLISFACKYTRVLVIKRAARQNLIQVRVFQLSLHAYKWVILMDDNLH